MTHDSVTTLCICPLFAIFTQLLSYHHCLIEIYICCKIVWYCDCLHCGDYRLHIKKLASELLWTVKPNKSHSDQNSQIITTWPVRVDVLECNAALNSSRKYICWKSQNAWTELYWYLPLAIYFKSFSCVYNNSWTKFKNLLTLWNPFPWTSNSDLF